MSPTGGLDPLGVLLLLLLVLFGLGLTITILVVGLGLISRLVGRLLLCVFGIIGDVFSMAANLLVAPFTLARAIVLLVIGRFGEADAGARRFQDRIVEIGRAVWSAAVQRPLRVLGLRIPPQARRYGAMTPVPPARSGLSADGARPEPAPGGVAAGAAGPVPAPARRDPPPWPDPSVVAGGFPGYAIETRLPSGGSGARLYAAIPEPAKRASLVGAPDRVVIKSFAIGEGSTLPQIIRESRSLDAARSLGLVLDHALEPHRFWYAMPHFEGPTLTALANARHRSAAGPGGLEPSAQRELVALIADVVEELSRFHRAGLWHKDVKPDNIIVSGGRAHLIDVGLVTPLASSFTLTTHGTEYFRDPEMVRQALRGAKVHQVDGAKFDLYSAGAVLYAVLENTFPAHGPLSRFEKPSPEALRWIARRAMADYQQRYATAEQMLADLRFVLMAVDARSVRPVDLPSMRGAADRDEGSGGFDPADQAASPSGARFGAAAAPRAHEALETPRSATDAGRAGFNDAPAWRRTGPSRACRSTPVEARSTGAGRCWGVGRRRSAHPSSGASAWSPWATAAIALALIGVVAVKASRSERGRDAGSPSASRMSWTFDRGSGWRQRSRIQTSSIAGNPGFDPAAGLPAGAGAVLVERSAMIGSSLPEAGESEALSAISSKGWTPVLNDPEAFAAVASLAGREPDALRAELTRRGYRGLVRLEQRGDRVLVRPVAITEP